MNNNSNIEIIHRTGGEISHPNCLVVTPYCEDPENPQVLATVDHFSERSDADGFPWKITPVVTQGVALKEAMTAAVKYAQENHVPAVLVDSHDFSTSAEKRQTDTKVLKVRT